MTLYGKDNFDKKAEDSEVEEGLVETDISLAEEEENAANKLKKIQAKLKACETARRELQEDVQRAKADFLNARKRLQEQSARDLERLRAEHFSQLLPLADSFEAAMNDPQWSEADQRWRQGVEGIYAQLSSLLQAAGVSAIDPLGTSFDPHEHEALNGEGDTVTAVYQKGYRLDNVVIRPAKVSVDPANTED